MSPVSEENLAAHAAKTGAKRVTKDALLDNIQKKEFMVHPGSCLTLCILTLQNGYTVTGESACADPAMFDKERGETLAYEAAEKKIWPLMGYALKQEIYLAGDGSFLDRMVREARELEDKIVKLVAFMGGDTFAKLDLNERSLMWEQRDAMTSYLGSLRERIDLRSK